VALDYIDVVTFGDLLVRAADRFPDRDAVVFPDQRHTYASLLDASVRAARSLLGLGVGRGDHIGILMPNCMDFVEVMFGGAMIGAWIVPINARFKGRELAYVTENADLKVLVTSDIVDQFTDYVEILHDCLPGLADAPDPADLRLDVTPELRAVVLLGSSSPAGMVDRAAWDTGAGAATDDDVHRLRTRIALRDVAMMLYTSGTTAMPKGCPLTHEALVRTALVAGRTRFAFTRDDVLWDPLPLFHMSSILPMIGVFDAGGSYVTLTHVDPGVGLRQIKDERCTVSFATFPTVTQALLHHPDYRPGDFDGIRLMNNVAPPDQLRAIHAALPKTKHMAAYGCTEAGGVVAFHSPDDPDEVRATTSGHPFSGIELQVRDPATGEALPADEPGQIWVRGYNMFEGYYKDPEKNAESFDADGWFNTGDIGRFDVDGRIAYVGRTKDMLKVGGENVAAIEIESYLVTHPAVAVAQVVGVPDAKYDEVPAAFVQLKPGQRVDERELIDFCVGTISSFKVPRYVRFVDEWPMSATKIQKFRLRQKLCQELGFEG
jgi:acyl-CoA synthetase (AMP-forming)/AMP-acid ligase II